MKNRLEECRKKLKLTQQELAEKVDVTRQTIIALEQGRYTPSLELAYAIAKTLRCKHVEDVFLPE